MAHLHANEPMVRLLGEQLAALHRSLPREERRLFEALLLLTDDPCLVDTMTLAA
jgi:hypothetical protein